LSSLFTARRSPDQESIEDISQTAKTLNFMVLQAEEIMQKFKLHNEPGKLKIYKEKQAVN